ncbi:MAG: hypothetical protein IKE20_06060 [Eggerthellaceae bacterium]|nr:hypothetical protein [Eggerthellaceae bacterium]
MSKRMEGLTKESRDRAKEFTDSRSLAKEIADSRKSTLDLLAEIDSLDDDIVEARDSADNSVRNEAKGDFNQRVETAMEQAERGAQDTQDRIRESTEDAQDNRGKLESIAGSADYGAEGIRGAANRAEQAGREYSRIGEDLESAAETARQEIADRKREIDS